MRHPRIARIVLPVLGLLVASTAPLLYSQDKGTGGGQKQIESGMPPVMIHPTVEAAEHARAAFKASRPVRSKNLSYHGGYNGVGVETAPLIYLVFWGSQWNGNDPSGEASILQSFYSGVGSSSWLNSVTQYCQGVSSGTVFCNGAGQAAGNPAGILAGVWSDNGSAAPSQPSQSQLAAEAVNAAGHFGISDNSTVQYVIATAHGNNASGFGTQYCAWHSSTSSSVGQIAYTNLPYITDAGASCGANFNGLGATAGITIVGGHEMAETITDQFPNTGWLDSGGSENGDKCAWITSGQGASADTTFPNGSTFPVQSLWSNAFNSGAGGCVLSY
ncbi:MAG TPA: hypothetical protein VGS02_20305 [Acidobacteriaceae bacterium]|nr:hypothetical protein [Acidobacteriaceae bacterium]